MFKQSIPTYSIQTKIRGLKIHIKRLVILSERNRHFSFDGIAHSLKGSALKKAHEKYRLSRGTNANQNLASLLAGGKIVAEKSRVSFDKVTGEPVRMNVGFTFATEFETESVNTDVMTDEELLALMEKAEKALSVREAAKIEAGAAK